MTESPLKKLILIEQEQTHRIGNEKPITNFVIHGDVSECFPGLFPNWIPQNGHVFNLFVDGQKVAFQVQFTQHSIIDAPEIATIICYRLPWVSDLYHPLATIDPGARGKNVIEMIQKTKSRISLIKSDLKKA